MPQIEQINTDIKLICGLLRFRKFQFQKVLMPQRIKFNAIFFSLLFGLGTSAAAQNTADKQIAAFNDKFTHAIRTMNNAEVLSLWAEDGVSLLPNMNPISGKAAIQKFMDEVTANTTGYKVVSHDNDFHDIQISDDWASEWALTTQVVQPPGGQPRMTIHGKMLLVLHREKDGAWKIKAESWTSSPNQ